MPAFSGRNVRIKYDPGTGLKVIAGARTDTLTVNNTRIDITDKDDAGIATALDDIAVQSISISVSGILKDDTLLSLVDSATASSTLIDLEIDIGSLRNYAGSWFPDSFEVTGETEEGTTFTAQFSSSGTITKTTP